MGLLLKYPMSRYPGGRGLGRGGRAPDAVDKATDTAEETARGKRAQKEVGQGLRVQALLAEDERGVRPEVHLPDLEPFPRKWVL